jgi:hypothetical protein
MTRDCMTSELERLKSFGKEIGCQEPPALRQGCIRLDLCKQIGMDVRACLGGLGLRILPANRSENRIHNAVILGVHFVSSGS